MKFRVCAGWALVVSTMLLTLAQQTAADPLPLPAALPVYGKPGQGLIRVETRGEGWNHPGIYWLPKDTPLAELLRRAGIPNVTKLGEDLPWAVIVKRGDKYPEKFSLEQFESGKIKVTFVLDGGDIVTMMEADL